MTKRCSKCGEDKDIAKFHADKKSADGWCPHCLECRREYYRGWIEKNRERSREVAKRWRARNLDHDREVRRNRMRLAYKANPEKCRDVSARWAKNHRDSRAQKEGRRRAMGQCNWADKEKILEIYQLAQEFREAGFDVEVDHIIPLNGSSVCGLHVETNLRVCLTDVNRAKGNQVMENY